MAALKKIFDPDNPPKKIGISQKTNDFPEFSTGQAGKGKQYG